MLKKIKERINNSNIMKNSMIIIFGQTLASGISLINTFLLIKLVGVYGLGILYIAQTYSSIFGSLFNFQSYNAMIKYGADALEEQNEDKFKRYLKQSIIQDLITAIIAFTVGYLLVDFIGKYMEWDKQLILFIKVFMFTTLFNVTGAINALLRLFNKFKPAAYIEVITVLLKLFLILIGALMNFELSYYIYIEVFTFILSKLLLIIEGYKSLKGTKYINFFRSKIGFDREFTLFNVNNNIVNVFDLPTQQLTTLVINKLLGIEQVGIYNVCVRLGTLISRISSPVAQAMLPEISKMVAQRKYKIAFTFAKKLFLYTIIPGILLSIVVIISYEFWLQFLMDSNLKNAVTLSMYFLYVTISCSVAGVHLLFICYNLVKYNLPLVLIFNSIYLVLLYIITVKLGLIGVIIALILQAVMIALAKLLIIRNFLIHAK